jgi:tetratricopeptide (TPR) repeat protein
LIFAEVENDSQAKQVHLSCARADVDKALAALRLNPNQSADLYHSFAWLLATYPDPTLRDAAEAVELARRVVDLSPASKASLNTLGVALYRAGEWQAAADYLVQSEILDPGHNSSFNFFFLAMAHWQLGQKDKANELYRQAVEWMEANAPRDSELLRFRQEAAELLGIQFDDKSLPAPTTPGDQPSALRPLNERARVSRRSH